MQIKLSWVFVYNNAVFQVIRFCFPKFEEEIYPQNNSIYVYIIINCINKNIAVTWSEKVSYWYGWI